MIVVLGGPHDSPEMQVVQCLHVSRVDDTTVMLEGVAGAETGAETRAIETFVIVMSDFGTPIINWTTKAHRERLQQLGQAQQQFGAAGVEDLPQA